MSPDDRRVLFIVLAVVGLLSCGCLCLPFGAALSLPVIANLRKAAEKAQADRDARQRPDRAAARPWMGPRPPRFRGPPDEIPFAEPPAGMPPEGFAPPDFPIPIPPSVRPPVPPTGPPGVERLRGLGELTESQRQVIFRLVQSSTKHHERMQEAVIKHRERLKQENIDTAHAERTIAERKRLHEAHLDNLCRSHRISREELDQIIAEGKRKNW